MRLSEIQSCFTDHMFDVVDRIEHPDEEFAGLFETSPVPLSEQLSIYRTHVVKTLRQVIESNFPIVKKITGEDFFRTMATHYVMNHPPKEACLNYYGHDFDDFIASYEAASSIPYLRDCALLDRALNMTYYAEDQNVVDLSAINPAHYEKVCFQLADHVQLISSLYPLDEIYYYCANDKDSTMEISGKRRSCLAIVRIGEKAEIVRLTKDEFLLLQNIQDGEPLGSALERVFEVDLTFNFDAFMQNMMALRVFCSFYYLGD